MYLFYKDYFSPTEFNPSIRTRDIDFLVHRPVTIRKKIDISELLKDLGFIITFNNNGYMRLEHPEIIIEFLVAEVGRGTDKPIQIKELGINAQALHHCFLLKMGMDSRRRGNDIWGVIFYLAAPV